jgi:acyl carrier protein
MNLFAASFRCGGLENSSSFVNKYRWLIFTRFLKRQPCMQDSAQRVIDVAIGRVNELLPADQPLSKDPQTPLLGPNGRLDSMGFVNLLVSLEEELDAQLGLTVVLADEISAEEGISTISDLHSALARIIEGAKGKDSSPEARA